jgi:hypothetical protein
VRFWNISEGPDRLRLRQGQARCIVDRDMDELVACRWLSPFWRSHRVVQFSSFATWGSSGIEPDQGKAISSLGTYETILHRLRIDGTEFNWSKKEITAQLGHYRVPAKRQ